MINIQLSVREALTMVANGCDHYMFERIVCALEVALGVSKRCHVVVTKFNCDERIPCIKSIRRYTGWGLREAKDWTDVMMGRYDSHIGNWVGGANQHTMQLDNPNNAESLLRELVEHGCEGYLS